MSSACDSTDWNDVPKLFSWRKGLAIPAVLALTLGAVALSSTAANAADDTLVVTSPTNGQTVESRTVTFTGTGTDGSTVNVLDEEGDRIPGTDAATVTGGVWSTTGTYDETDPVAQTVRVTQVTGGSGGGEETITFSLPPAYNFSVTSPVDGETVASRTVTFTGTGTDGSTVNVLDQDGNRVPGTEAATVTDGVWSTTGTYADDAEIEQTVDVNQVTGGAGRGEQSVTFDLPAVLLPAPVITSPVNGETVTGPTVTFAGTATPGTNIVLAIVPTDELDQLSTLAAPTPADPEDPIVVDAAGNWTVTLAIEPGDYTAAAILAELDADNVLVDIISEPSAPVQFLQVAAAAVVTPADNSSTGQLANTGYDLSGYGLAALLMALIGAGILITRRTLSAN